MDIVLPKTIAEKLQKKAKYTVTSVEKYLLDVLTKDYDPETTAEKHLSTALEHLEQTKEELKESDLRQSSKKIRNTCTPAIKAHAPARKSKRTESHTELWVYKNEVTKNSITELKWYSK
ncbi:MAG: hypothetical protein DRJ40_02690 [Thermoprotei archaeon]|nr:MAG: hypothetical protein DRJ40_02690 [Thermoprotei archaeon]